jgi:sec-independent protein translocase protein TatB
MFDISFTELLVIAVVALIVIGPERLPKVARTLGHLFGRMQRYVNDVKADISREMELDELKKLQSGMEDAARSMRDSVNSTVDSVNKEVSETESELSKLAHADTNPEPLPLPAPAATPAPAETPSSQGELPLEPGSQAPERKQA